MDGLASTRIESTYVDISDVTPYADNPRFNEKAIQSVANSISNFGFLVPIVLDDENIVVAGHTRLEAAKLLGLNDVPVIYANHLNDDQIRQFRLIDNKVSELALWDYDMLAGEITALADTGVDLTQFGWTHDEIDCLTDVVNEDCLSAGAGGNADAPAPSSGERRAPSQTRFVCGEFVFFVPAEAYKRWAAQIRNESDYDEKEIQGRLQDLLGVTPYLE